MMPLHIQGKNPSLSQPAPAETPQDEAHHDSVYPPIGSKRELAEAILAVGHGAKTPLDLCRRLDRSNPHLWLDARHAIAGVL